jgi:hypothetical protein
LWGIILHNDNDATMANGFADLMYVTSSDVTPGGTRMPVANRMDPVYVSIAVRPNNTFTMSQSYVSNNYAGSFSRLRGRNITILLELRADGGALVEEYIFLLNCAFNEIPTSMPDNSMLTVSASGYFDAEMHIEV